jgi:two-component system, OmpR family, KDP operon response regulator KdpE
MLDTTRVLVVDEEAQAARALGSVLTSHGYDVSTSLDGESALSTVAEWRPHLVLTDWSVPRMDGPELCRRIRAVSRVPIIVLSRERAEQAKVEALDSGADDYLTKPFGADELRARVRAALRRAGSSESDDVPMLEVGEFRIDLQGRRVHVRGQQVRLTPKEFDLFVYMARRPNRVIPHRALLESVWGESSRERPEYLRVYIGHLRQKLELNPAQPKHLATEPWVGYRFNPTTT